MVYRAPYYILINIIVRLTIVTAFRFSSTESKVERLIVLVEPWPSSLTKFNPPGVRSKEPNITLRSVPFFKEEEDVAEVLSIFIFEDVRPHRLVPMQRTHLVVGCRYVH